MKPSPHSDQHTVSIRGPFVIKRLLGKNAQRRFYSELLTRATLKKAEIKFIPVLFSLAPMHLLVMPRYSNQNSSDDLDANVHALAAHVRSMATRMKNTDCPDGFFWLDRPDSIRRSVSFKGFLTDQVGRYVRRYGDGFLHGQGGYINKSFETCPAGSDRVLCLHDVSPKNVFFRNHTIVHFDLEGTLVGPSDYFLVKTATNFVRDIGTPGIKAAEWLLSGCKSPEFVNASLSFSLVRMLLFHQLFGGVLNPIKALSALANGHPGTAVLEEIALARDAVAPSQNPEE